MVREGRQRIREREKDISKKLEQVEEEGRRGRRERTKKAEDEEGRGG